MTVAAWDGETLAVDSALSLGGARQSTTKISAFEADGRPHAAVGIGSTRACLAMQRWAESGGNPDEFPRVLAADEDDSWMVVVDLELGRVDLYAGTAEPIPIESVPASWGRGSDVALGAMLHGASAASAVRTACRHVDGCAGPVRFATRGRPGEVLTA